MSLLNRTIKKVRQLLQRKDSMKGFTVLELLVALSLFSILTAVSVGIFVRALQMHREIIAFSNTLDVSGQILEQMTREMRTGSNFVVEGSPSSKIAFINARGEDVGYQLVNGVIGRCVEGCLSVPLGEEATYYRPLHDKTLTVDRLMFLGSGFAPNDNLPPFVVISLRLKGPWDKVVQLQTSVSSRTLGE